MKKNNITEENMRVEKFERMLHEMAENIVSLEWNVKEIKSKEDSKAKEFAKKIGH